MTVDISQPAPCQHRLHIRVLPELIQPVREGVVREFQRDANIAGFRKGKAPRELVEGRFPTEIREETLRRLTRQVFEQVQEERRLKPVGPFEVTKLAFDEAKGLDLEADVEVEPDFSLGSYREIPLTRRPPAVTPEEIDQVLKQLQESAAQLVPTNEGQKEKQLPAIDDDLAKELGQENLQQLKAHLEAKLRERKKSEATQALEQELCEALVSRHPFEVPPRLVAKQQERLARDFQARLLLAGRTEEQIKADLVGYTEQLQTNALRHVKLAFILDRIAEQEQLAVTQEEIVDRLWTLAKQWDKDPAEVRRLLDAKGWWPSVVSSIRQDKTIAWLLNAARIEDQKLMNAPVNSE